LGRVARIYQDGKKGKGKSMNKSESIQNLVGALCKAQAEFPAIEFDSVNPFLKNRYASLGANISGTRPALTKYGLAVTQLTFGNDNEIGVETVLAHTSGEWISERVSMPIGEERGKSSAQVAGSIVTYLRRYALASILGIYADEDRDGAEARPAPVKTREEKPEAKPAENLPISETMTIEDACKVETSDDPPRRYGDLTIPELSVRFNELSKQLKDSNLDPAERAVKERKLKAAKMIIDAKRNKEF